MPAKSDEILLRHMRDDVADSSNILKTVVHSDLPGLFRELERHLDG